ncbi:hypothetical protein Zmor_022113 [Zophobas morio]|uniref:protein-serine/threonine phosphatase n=1 Tax=Zophobas morio TaxID=2755281 RepID=A0AA38HNT3_9CUCU|nr:hypothetical protein Zmor_022113 [Zophobas morio]
MAIDLRETFLEAEEFKKLGNDFYKEKKYEDAIDCYTKAIELDSNNAIYLANRAMAYLKTEAYGYALADSSKAIELDPHYLKGYYRRASANLALNKYKESLKDFQTITKLAPKNKVAKEKSKECEKIIRQILFVEAISFDDCKKSVVDDIHLDSIKVEDSYLGPSLPSDGKVTEDFLKSLISWFKDQKPLHKKFAFQIIIEARKLFAGYESLVYVDIPENAVFNICGDTHGQFYDLLHIFEINGYPGPNNLYLFNGDFVDRGSFSYEVIFVLFSLKLLHPEYFFLSRGNHETVSMNRMYGFAGEVKAKGTELMLKLFHETFCCLPLAYVVEKKIFCVHGGLFSEDGVTLDDIRKINRFQEPPESGLMCDLLWSDPMPQNGRSPSKRGVGLHFGPDVTQQFLAHNQLEYIVRSHEVKDNGYEIAHDGKCITVFSAPNYCDQMGNKGAILTVTKNDLSPQFKTFTHVPHPDVKPMAYMNMGTMFEL